MQLAAWDYLGSLDSGPDERWWGLPRGDVCRSRQKKRATRFRHFTADYEGRGGLDVISSVPQWDQLLQPTWTGCRHVYFQNAPLLFHLLYHLPSTLSKAQLQIPVVKRKRDESNSGIVRLWIDQAGPQVKSERAAKEDVNRSSLFTTASRWLGCLLIVLCGAKR